MTSFAGAWLKASVKLLLFGLAVPSPKTFSERVVLVALLLRLTPTLPLTILIVCCKIALAPDWSEPPNSLSWLVES